MVERVRLKRFKGLPRQKVGQKNLDNPLGGPPLIIRSERHGVTCGRGYSMNSSRGDRTRTRLPFTENNANIFSTIGKITALAVIAPIIIGIMYSLWEFSSYPCLCSLPLQYFSADPLSPPPNLCLCFFVCLFLFFFFLSRSSLSYVQDNASNSGSTWSFP